MHVPSVVSNVQTINRNVLVCLLIILNSKNNVSMIVISAAAAAAAIVKTITTHAIAPTAVLIQQLTNDTVKELSQGVVRYHTVQSFVFEVVYDVGMLRCAVQCENAFIS